MKRIILSAFAIASLSVVSVSANQVDDIMQSKSSQQSTEQSRVTTRGSGSIKKHAAEADRIKLEQFASSNSDQLAKEIAAGNGEMLNTLATLMKVEDKAIFSAKLQTNYNNIYTSKDVTSQEVLNNISQI